MCKFSTRSCSPNLDAPNADKQLIAVFVCAVSREQLLDKGALSRGREELACDTRMSAKLIPE
jgi:hypothetical protein